MVSSAAIPSARGASRSSTPELQIQRLRLERKAKEYRVSRSRISPRLAALPVSGAALLFALSAVEVSANASPAATGGGKTDWGGYKTNISFAVHTTDEGASGHANVQIFFDQGDPRHVTVDLDCLRIVGDDVAVVSGTILTSEIEQDPYFDPGDTVVFAVQDHGEGEGAIDQLSTIWSYSYYVPDACQTFTPPMADEVGGNVQVHT